MDYATFASALTVVAFATFIGIVIWAYSRKRRTDFEAAARLPFVLPEEKSAERIIGGNER